MTLQAPRALRRWVAIAAAASVLAAATVIAGLISVPKTMLVEIVNEGTTPDAATFEPGTVIMQPGTTVVWKNSDASAHTVTSSEPAGVFDSGVMGPEEEFEFTFEKSGTFDYYCKVHPVMVGSVQVQ